MRDKNSDNFLDHADVPHQFLLSIHARYSSYGTHREFSSPATSFPVLIASSSLPSSPLQSPSHARRQEPLLLKHNTDNLFLQAQITEGSSEGLIKKQTTMNS